MIFPQYGAQREDWGGGRKLTLACLEKSGTSSRRRYELSLEGRMEDESRKGSIGGEGAKMRTKSKCVCVSVH